MFPVFASHGRVEMLTMAFEFDAVPIAGGAPCLLVLAPFMFALNGAHKHIGEDW